MTVREAASHGGWLLSRVVAIVVVLVILMFLMMIGAIGISA